jgi:hypothetical protein
MLTAKQHLFSKVNTGMLAVNHIKGLAGLRRKYTVAATIVQKATYGAA